MACMVRRLASCTGSLGALLDAPSSLSDSLQRVPLLLTYLPTYWLANGASLTLTCLPTYHFFPLLLSASGASPPLSLSPTLSLLSLGTPGAQSAASGPAARASHVPGREYLHGRVVCIGSGRHRTGPHAFVSMHAFRIGLDARVARRRARERAEGCGGGAGRSR